VELGLHGVQARDIKPLPPAERFPPTYPLRRYQTGPSDIKLYFSFSKKPQMHTASQPSPKKTTATPTKLFQAAFPITPLKITKCLKDFRTVKFQPVMRIVAPKKLQAAAARHRTPHLSPIIFRIAQYVPTRNFQRTTSTAGFPHELEARKAICSGRVSGSSLPCTFK